MAKFLNTSAINYLLEDLIKKASDRLILISPYLKLNDRVKELIEDKNRLKIDIRIVYGKSELQAEEIKWLNDLSFVRTSFCKNLHAKCYINESCGIISSLNLYDFSQVNNNEMGVFISREDDIELYRDTYEEAQRIIRISDEVGITQVSPLDDASEGSDVQKLSSSKIAKNLGLKTDQFIDELLSRGFISEIGNKNNLTEKGISSGGEFKFSKRFGSYYLWPEDFKFS